MLEPYPTSAKVQHVMSESHPSHFSRVRVDSAGRVVIPAEVRQHIGIETGQDLILSEDEQGIHIQTFRGTNKRAC